MNEIKKENIKKKIDHIKMATLQKTYNVLAWVSDHKEECKVWGPIVIGSGFALCKTLGKAKVRKDVKDLYDLYCYDRRQGHYWKMKRKPRNDEWRIIAIRKNNGEELGEILNDLRLL